MDFVSFQMYLQSAASGIWKTFFWISSAFIFVTAIMISLNSSNFILSISALVNNLLNDKIKLCIEVLGSEKLIHTKANYRLFSLTKYLIETKAGHRRYCIHVHEWLRNQVYFHCAHRRLKCFCACISNMSSKKCQLIT